MPTLRQKLGVTAIALLLSGCSYGDRLFGWNSTNQSGDSTKFQIAPAASETNPEPTVTAMPLQPAGGAGTQTSTSTVVGQKVQGLRGDLQRLEGNLASRQQQLAQTRQTQEHDATTYFGLIAAIDSRLQIGTTPGNPELVAQWNQAQSSLDRMSDDIAQLNSLANVAAGDSSFGAYLLDATHAAYSLQGAVDEDHRQLHQIETETNATMARIDQLLNSLSQDINRQSGYVAGERSNLVTLSLAIQNGQLYGPSFANRNFTAASAPAAAAAPAPARSSVASAAPAAAAPGDRPLVIIRFDKPDVPYEQALYTAVSRALERKPTATFDIVAVSPNAGTPAQVAVNSNASRQNAENVMRSLTNMGLPGERVSLSATMSPDVDANEVRLFVR
jgi:hypothetical protein